MYLVFSGLKSKTIVKIYFDFHDTRNSENSFKIMQPVSEYKRNDARYHTPIPQVSRRMISQGNFFCLFIRPVNLTMIAIYQ